MGKYIYMCKECGSTDIQILMWVNPNTDEIVDDNGEDTCWCEKCQSENKYECYPNKESID